MSVTLDRVLKRFDGAAAVDGASVSIADGEFFVVLGPSGCGKSTLLRLIAGLERLDAGAIEIDGETVADAQTHMPPERRRVAVVFQSYALWPHLSVLRNVSFPMEAAGMATAAWRAEAQAHLETVELGPFADRLPAALSGGQRQRVALARCLAGGARTVLMDEPLANLDPHLRATMETELAAFHRRTGATTLYITHDQREAMALADRVAVMQAGRFLQVAPPEEIYERPTSAQVARFIGRSALLDAEMVVGADRAEARLMNGAVVPISREAQAVEGRARIMIRPESVALSAPDATRVATPGSSFGPTSGAASGAAEIGLADGDMLAPLAAVVAEVHYRGGVYEAEAQVAGLAETIPLTSRARLSPGEPVSLMIASAWPLPPEERTAVRDEGAA